ncbi:MAG: SpoIIE family protein phosphatase [Deltaproteobacteria bacterium]|nr:SpoIIE family protein phosphatase [Deltaproteobacteria bacterium]
MKEIIALVVTLINSMAVMSVIAYILSRSRFYDDFLEKKVTWKNRLLLILVFGLLSIYGTMSGFKFMGAVANTRDLGPALAGLFAGPVAGIGAGLIGAIHRYSMGGFTEVSCSVATIVSGLVGGLVFMWRRGAFVGVTGAVVVAAVNQVLHSGLTLLIARPFEQSREIVEVFTLPMILANAIGMAIYTSIVVNLVKQRSWEHEKHTIEGELNAAREIQMSMVPKMFPPFPDRPEFELTATIEPAKEVGGDFYDFFFVDQHHLVFLLGDVSGKGIPASLFMAVTKTLLKAVADRDTSIDQVLYKVNNRLCEGNDMSMFATVFCGILDVRTGKVEYSNAGHNPPVICRRGGNSEYLPTQGSLAIGSFEDSPYIRETLTLGVGDTIIIYSDGVTEAMNKEEALFSEERLLESLQPLNGHHPDELLKKILKDVHDHAAGAPQSDDITILGMQYKGLPDDVTEQ